MIPSVLICIRDVRSNTRVCANLPAIGSLSIARDTVRMRIDRVQEWDRSANQLLCLPSQLEEGQKEPCASLLAADRSGTCFCMQRCAAPGRSCAAGVRIFSRSMPASLGLALITSMFACSTHAVFRLLLKYFLANEP